MPSTIELTPSQQKALGQLRSALGVADIVELSSRTGRGRTTVLRRLHEEVGGRYLSAQDFVDAAGKRHPLGLEDALYEMLLDALRQDQTVIVDDLDVMTAVMGGCHFYPRAGLLDAPALVVAQYVAASGKKLVLGTGKDLPGPLDERCCSVRLGGFSPRDYRHLLAAYLGEAGAALDAAKIHRFAPKLNGHQMRGACEWLRQGSPPDTDSFIDYLRTQRLASNVQLGEVAEVDLRDLKGVDDVIRSLEANVVLPLENDRLALELDLRAKRGVLLVGPPGTGKTTVGRALAHRLRGKFFLIDGTCISGTRDFYNAIHRIFHEAQENAPAVIFIDDSDVIFESGQEHGLYRYLLTMLDGLESKSAGRVCVMMTAMDVGNLPPAMVRSGRIELWLEMRLPDEEARLAILESLAAGLPAALAGLDVGRLAAASDEFTGADLKRTLDDGKALYAYDRARNRPLQPVTEYFLAAVQTVRDNKDRYAEAERRAHAARPERPAWFNPASMHAGNGE